MGNYTIFKMFENPRRGRQARNFTTNVPKILDLKSSSEQIFSENCRWVPLTKSMSGKLLYGATVLTTARPTVVSCVRDFEFSSVVEILGFSSGQVKNYMEKYTDDDKDAGDTIWQHINISQ